MEVSVQTEREYTRLKDLIYRRYGGSAGEVLAMPFFDGFEILRYALDAEVEDRLFLRWAVMYQSQMGFEEFKSSMVPANYQQYQGQADADTQTAAEILKKVKSITG